MKSVFVLVLVLIPAFEINAQIRQIMGKVTNSAGVPLQGVMVTVKQADSSRIAGFSVSGVHGDFLIRFLQATGRLVVEFRHLGFETETRYLEPGSWPNDLKILLVEKPTELKEIVIKRELPVLIRSDTVVFNANSYRDSEVRKVEDLLKKMQGFSVDPSGKLMFNGKSVEKVLIDGDDLAGQGYQMITKNLDAITVDKVEVVNNYSDNRLMRKVIESGKVGVNLKISSRFKSKLSGSTEAGFSLERRYNADVNTIFIGRDLKWLIFGSYNNVARDVSGNAKYYYEQEAGHMSGGESPAGIALLETGIILMPSIGERYTRENNDLGFAVMNSWKSGKYSRMNGMVGYDDLSLINRASNAVYTDFSDAGRWSLYNSMFKSSSSRDLITRFSFQRDAGKNQVTRVELVANLGRHHDHFMSETTGDISDSLNENLVDRFASIRLKAQQTWLLKAKVLQLNFGYESGLMDQDMDIWSSRFLSYWKLDSSYLLNHQWLEKQKTKKNLQLKINGRTKHLQYEYGITAEDLTVKYQAKSLINSEDSRPQMENAMKLSCLSDLSFKGIHKSLLELNRSDLIGLSASMGFESLDTGQEDKGFLVYDVGLSYIKKIGLMNSFRINFKVGRGFRRYDQLYPDQLMSGNASILNGLNFSEPELSRGLNFSYSSVNISKQRNWSANFSYNRLPVRYVNSYELFPEYTFQFFQIGRFSGMLNSGLTGESYVRLLKSKLGGLVNLSSAKDRNTVNGVDGSSVRTNMNLEGWLVSGFVFPVNLELRLGAIYSSGNWNGGESNKIWQGYWSCKIKIKPGKKLYSSMVLNVRDLSDKEKFYGLDFFVSYKLNTAFIFSLNGVNLLNLERVADVSVMPFSRSEVVYQIVPRYLLASINWTF